MENALIQVMSLSAHVLITRHKEVYHIQVRATNLVDHGPSIHHTGGKSVHPHDVQAV